MITLTGNRVVTLVGEINVTNLIYKELIHFRRKTEHSAQFILACLKADWSSMYADAFLKTEKFCNDFISDKKLDYYRENKSKDEVNSEYVWIYERLFERLNRKSLSYLLENFGDHTEELFPKSKPDFITTIIEHSDARFLEEMIFDFFDGLSLKNYLASKGYNIYIDEKLHRMKSKGQIIRQIVNIKYNIQ